MGTATTQGRAAFEKARILVVDDEAMSRTLARSVITRFGCEAVDVAVNGADAVNRLAGAAFPYSVVVSDYQMPGLNGLQLLKGIRCGIRGVSRDLRFAMLTAYSDREIVGAAFELDVDCFILKPASADQMRARLNRTLLNVRPIKNPETYADTDVPPFGPTIPPIPKDLLSPYVLRRVKAVEQTRRGIVRAKPKPAEKQLSGAGIPLSEVRPGSTLTEDLLAGNGHMLLKSGAVLDQRLIDRLKNLAEVDPAVDSVVITPPDDGDKWIVG